MANGDDAFQIDPAQLIPVTGRLSGSAPGAAPVKFEDLRAFLPQGSKQQTSSQAAQATDFDPKTAASLDNLQPDFADRAKQWIEGMRKAGYNPMLHFGGRTPEEQQVLYQKYLAGGNKAVAPPMSYHTYGRAFDWVNKDEKGNLQWDNDKAYQFGQVLAKNYGLTGIGPGDNDHIQDANYKSWKDLPRSEYGNIAKRQAAQEQKPVPIQEPLIASSDPTWQDLSQYLTPRQ